MTDDRVRSMWTEQQLDDALGALHREPAAHDLGAVRAALTVETQRPQHRRRWHVTAAAAAAVVAAVAVASTVHFGHGDSGNSGSGPRETLTAAGVLNAAAGTATRGDPKPGPGEYTKINTRAWFATGGPVPSRIGRPEQHGSLPTYLSEDRYEQWVPPNGAGTWYWRYTRGTDVKFLHPGDEATLRRHGINPRERSRELYVGEQNQITAMIYDGAPHPSGDRRLPANWGLPTPRFLAAQPRDPRALLDKLVHDPNKRVLMNGSRGDTQFLHLTQVLGSGIVPADLRAALYRAATLIPGVRLLDSAANLDGERGVAVGRVDSTGRVRQELIFDSAGGRFIGEREVALRHGGVDDLNPTPVPNGRTIESTALTVGVAGKPPFA